MVLFGEFTAHFDLYNTHTVQVKADSFPGLWKQFIGHIEDYYDGAMPVAVTLRLMREGPSTPEPQRKSA